MDDAILTMSEVHKRFGGVQALAGVDVEIGHGITGFIGPNGSGKTTLFNCVNGVGRADAGTITWLGEDITRRSVPLRARRGISAAPQNPSVFARSTAIENVQIAVEVAARLEGKRGDRQSAPQSIDDIIGLCGLTEVGEDEAGALSYGHQRLLNVAMALAVRPLVLLLDEPGAGLDDDDKRRLASVTRALSARGISVLLIEHDVSFLFELSDRVVVLNAGQVIAHGPPEEVRADKEVVRVYLG